MTSPIGRPFRCRSTERLADPVR